LTCLVRQHTSLSLSVVWVASAYPVRLCACLWCGARATSFRKPSIGLRPPICIWIFFTIGWVLTGNSKSKLKFKVHIRAGRSNPIVVLIRRCLDRNCRNRNQN
ncbi:unnamed protein product, partial [Pylaiella littoralis]